MKIGIDVQSTKGRKTGLGVYTDHLVCSLTRELNHRHQYCLYGKEQAGDLNTPGRLWWENVELPHLAKKDRVDLLHIPAFAVPTRKPAKVVLTVHDLIGMIYPNQKGWPSRLYWGKWLPESARRADRIIADSENTKMDMIKHLSISEDLIRVIYPSGHENFTADISRENIEKLKERLGIQEKYFLYVGTIEPRKNLSRVIESFNHFIKDKQRSVRYQLVIVGSKQFAHGQVFKEILDRFGTSLDDILFSDYLKQEELNALYCGAEALLFPSLYEGWGIPILEAMASGTPVLTSNVSSIPEVCGEAALKVDPYSTEEIRNGIECLAQDENCRKSLVMQGFEQIKKFSWKRTAEQTLEVYESLG